MWKTAIASAALMSMVILTSLVAEGNHVKRHATPGPWVGVDSDGYLEFQAGTESFTGWTDAPIGGFGDTNDHPNADFDATHGDRADFDWVVDSAAAEIGVIPSFHGAVARSLRWFVAPTQPSAHIDVGVVGPHGHLALLLVCPAVPPSTTPSSELCNNDYGFREFTGVDVFSAISRTGTLAVSDTEATFRNAALDYVLNFDCVNVDDPQPGKVLQVFRDGWHPVATSDNFVARWIAPAGCIANAVRIDAAGPGLGHDDIAQIDAIKAFPTVPPPPPVPQPPSLVLLVAAALFALLWRHLRVDMM